MPGTRSSAATKCISDVPGLEKHVVTPLFNSECTRLSAPFISSAIGPCSIAGSVAGKQIAEKSGRSNVQSPGAALPDTEDGLEQWLELNTKFSAEWPNITQKKDPPEDADAHKGEAGKFEAYFTPEPGEGD